MTQAPTLPPVGTARPSTPARLGTQRLFYPVCAVACLFIALYGFKDFFLHGQAYPRHPLNPAIRVLLIIHGLAMTLWVLLLIAQPTIITMGKRKLHMAVGRYGAALAAIIVVLGYMTAIGAARNNPPELAIFGMLPPRFIHVPLTAITLFAVLVAVAVWQRKNPPVHRAMMLMATVNALSAALGRFTWINTHLGDSWWAQQLGPMHASVSLGLIFFALACLVYRRFEKWLALGVAILAVTYIAMLHFSATPAWESFAKMLIG
ncbi:MAG: hypothetical protein GC164_10290 [Phycisphaera sp.]|nr:hypothetical protein [Phycisphaera sp.]